MKDYYKTFNKNENLDYYLGNTAQFWIGSKPEVTHPKYSKVLAEINRIFQSYNIIKEVVTLFRNALLGNDISWYLTKDENDKVLTSIEESLQDWLEWQKVLNLQSNCHLIDAITDAVTLMLINEDENGIGSAYLRLYHPIRLTQIYKDKKDYYKTIMLHCPKHGCITPYRDDDGFVYKATYSYKTGLETYELLDNGMTLITTNDGSSEVDLGGVLPIFEMKGESLITQSVKQAQNSINKTLTLKGENLNYAGFLERVILNAQMPGRWVADDSAPNGERFIPSQEAMEFGASTINFLQGIAIRDPQSREVAGYTNPSINYRDPVSSSTFGDGIKIDIETIYRSVGLGHLLIQSDGNTSGVSRESLKSAFITKLSQYAAPIESCYQSILNTVGYLLGFPNLNPTVKINLATGKALVDERNQTILEYNAGLLSRATAMSLIGVDDPDAEIALIERDDALDNNKDSLTTEDLALENDILNQNDNEVENQIDTTNDNP